MSSSQSKRVAFSLILRYTNNKLSSITGNNLNATFQYNGLGERVSQTVNGVTTHFVLDQAAGLTQVLEDGTNAYLYGDGRIGQFGATDSEYYLSDALGSVRQLADENGDITLTKSYEPYGEILSTGGSGSSAYGYTGEMHDASTGMVYLRARYYSSQDGRFLSRDTWQGDMQIPMSYNAWLYTYANPILFTDPLGLTPSEPPSAITDARNDRDLTWWLYKELKANVNSYYIRRIRSLLGGSVSDISNAVNGWIYLVKDSAKWDFKHRVDLEIGRAITFFDNNQGFRWYEYSVPGNIFYGYIGSAAGFSGFMLHAGASYAEIKDPAHSKRGESCCPCPDLDNEFTDKCREILCLYTNPKWVLTGFDDPTDFHGVQLGIDLYNAYHENLTFSQLINHITVNGDKLAHPSASPSSFEWNNPRGGWPYNPGRFNGPDDVVNETKVLDYLR